MSEFRVVIKMSLRDDSDPFPGVECQHRARVITSAIQTSAAASIGAPSLACYNPQDYPELVVGEFLGWVLWLEIGYVWRKRNSNRRRACILNSDLESRLITDLIMRAVERHE